MLRLIGRILLWLLAGLGIATVAIFLVAVVMLTRLGDSAPDLPERMVLMIDLNRGVAETVSASPLALLRGKGPHTIRQVLEVLEKAGKDKRVAGLAVRLGTSRVGVAQAQELRDAVRRFRDAGKFAVVYADSFGLLANATTEYYLASAFDEVWMQPSGNLHVTGLALEIPFVAETFERIGVQPLIGQRHEYKSAPDTFKRRGLSAPARRNLQALVDRFFAQIVDGIAKSRGLKPDAVRALINGSPYLAAEAREKKLIDKLDYWPSFVQALKKRGGKDAKLVRLRPYAAEGDLPNRTGPTVALIHGIGPIVSGRPSADPLDDDPYFAAQEVAKAIRKAAADKSVKAILIRIDSPGGSYLASDTVWNALQQARSKGKPVIASMGRVAASGGYFVAMAADRIVAGPGTITGSIGVYGGKFVMRDLWKKLGVNWEAVYAGDHATMWSPMRDFPAGAAARLERSLDFVYADFTKKLADARKFSKSQVDATARGRVWSGEDALRVGLVDSLGGFTAAIAAVKDVLDLKPEDSIRLKAFPKPLSPFERVLAALDGKNGISVGLLVQALGLDSLFAGQDGDGLAALARELRLLRPPVGELQMPPIRLRQ
jgi:protease-4